MNHSRELQWNVIPDCLTAIEKQLLAVRLASNLAVSAVNERLNLQLIESFENLVVDI